MPSIRGASNQSYRNLFKGKREKLVKQHEEADSDAGQLARLVRLLQQAVTAADKEGFYFNKCPICGATAANPATRHHRDCAWPEFIVALREEKKL